MTKDNCKYGSIGNIFKQIEVRQIFLTLFRKQNSF